MLNFLRKSTATMEIEWEASMKMMLIGGESWVIMISADKSVSADYAKKWKLISR